MTGLGTMINILAVLVGATVGMLIGNRFSERTRETTTSGLGLITLVVGALNIGAIGDRAFADAVGADWTLIVVLGAVVLGGILGSLVRVEDRLNNIGGRLQKKFSGKKGSDDRARFIEGYVSASLLFCVGPLTILGSLSDGLGTGIDQLVLKSSLDLFAAMAFAASLGLGVMFSALTVAFVQGVLTICGVVFGSFMPDSLIAAMTAAGGVLLLGIGIRLLQLKEVRVADMLPALAVAPLLTLVIDSFR
ncbi:MAG: DUF554 domain-containing protein [Actinomycetota bacterium]|nr:DUF554 domain-containing protein [Actinomycetota bacterium]MEC7174319.1 DUF554 domain-containing protein [Actinomycetota bacterium]MEC7384533.1 DUF554 domain-containing protein [Actinomycetota bacterium]MEC7434810.1 DUF554 domain-containing protein [Actinomycetota bacterium]MEC8018981.1 DUF554 domain-containing protein [Actinomycetota bacterium]